MVPAPIAVLTLGYGLLATVSAAWVFRILNGASHQALPWAVGWLLLSAGAMVGLALLKPWGRTLAIAGAAGLLLASLAGAGVLVAAGWPLGALAATLTALVPLIVIRYLRRPAVKAWFQKVPGTF